LRERRGLPLSVGVRFDYERTRASVAGGESDQESNRTAAAHQNTFSPFKSDAV